MNDPGDSGESPIETDQGTEQETVSHDCTPWAGESRRILQSLLAGQEIPHAWEGTVVVVPAAFADELGELVDQVEVLATRTLDPAAEQVAFEVSGWSNEAQNILVEKLDDAGIAHEWDADGDLVVEQVFESSVEVIVDEILERGTDGDEGEELDGIELHEVLGRLFEASGRLVKDPEDFRRRSALLDDASTIAGAGTPFGYSEADWQGIQGSLEALVTAIVRTEGDDGGDRAGDTAEEADPGPDEPGIEELAAEVRDLLRNLV